MCGISGIYRYGKDGRPVADAELTLMRDTLAHRGPDGAANWIDPGGRAGLSQRRLAIIDLSTAAGCPLSNEDEQIWITFNGEIYNFKPLREELAAKGHIFKTQGDTETILHGYEEYGPDIVKRLNGMFAFALWDAKRKRLFAARDHVGIKPFYYAVQDDAFYFGSEIKAILAHPDFKKEMDEPMVGHYLAFSSMPAPHTLFKDVRKLPPAHYITVDADGTIGTHEYWNPLQPQAGLPARGASETEWVKTIRDLLDDSIQMQMVSDVPFGCFLSGGIDSSLNAALMSKALGAPVETFTIGTRADDAHGEKYNEFEQARRVAELLGAKRHERLVGYEDFTAFLDQYAQFADDPNGDQTCFLVFYLSELVRQSGVVVVQTGEGGDELFAGYGTYRTAARLHGLWRAAAWLPKPLRKALAGAAAMAAGRSEFAREYARRLAEGQEPFWGHATAFSPLQKQKLLAGAHRNDPRFYGEYAVIEEHYAAVDRYAPKADTVNRIGYLELKLRLADFLLMRVDKMGMAHSIEARVPFLDHRIVEAALRIPQKIKLAGGELKHVLKKVAEGALPTDIIHRKKQGFGAPLEEWFRDRRTAAPLLEKIYGSKLVTRGLFDYDYVRELAERHAQGENHTFRLMNLLTLSLWYDRWFGN